MDVLPRADYERHTRAMRALGEVHEVVGPVFACATVQGTVSRMAELDALLPWVKLGRDPSASVLLACTADGINVIAMVRGELP